MKTFKEFRIIKEQRFMVDVTLGYRGISGYDDITVVVNARNEDDAEDKAFDMLTKLRTQRKVGPGGGGSIEGGEFEVNSVEKTTQSVGLKSAGRSGP